MSRPPPYDKGEDEIGKKPKLQSPLTFASTDLKGRNSKNIRRAAQMPETEWEAFVQAASFPDFSDGYREDLYFDEKDRIALNEESELARENEIFMRRERRTRMHTNYFASKEKWAQLHQLSQESQPNSGQQIIDDGKGTRYQIVKVLGQGQFGTVYLAASVTYPSESQPVFAIKVAKPDYAYRQQAHHEVQIMQHIQNQSTEQDLKYILQLKDWFIYGECLCIVNERLSINLYEVLEKRNYKGLGLAIVQSVMKQLMLALITLEKRGVVHSDIKPENILLTDVHSLDVKLIDYGSARFIAQPSSNYIQSRYYRAPEVVLGIDHDYKIDVWSVACVGFELFNAFPLFPGQNEIHLLELIVDMLGEFPQEVVDLSPRKDLFHPNKTLKSEEDICKEHGTTVVNFRHYFKYRDLDSIVLTYKFLSKNENEIAQEKRRRVLFIDLLKKMLDLSPTRRLTPSQALKHPFITSDLTKL